jgi:hypothetical protein
VGYSRYGPRMCLEILKKSTKTESGYIKKPRFRFTQHIYVINNLELNSGQHVSITQDHLQPFVDTFLILKSRVICDLPLSRITFYKS